MRRHDRKSTRLNSSHTIISYAVSLDRKSTRLNSSHTIISYAVFCLQKNMPEKPAVDPRTWPTLVTLLPVDRAGRSPWGLCAGVAALATVLAVRSMVDHLFFNDTGTIEILVVVAHGTWRI